MVMTEAARAQLGTQARQITDTLERMRRQRHQIECPADIVEITKQDIEEHHQGRGDPRKDRAAARRSAGVLAPCSCGRDVRTSVGRCEVDVVVTALMGARPGCRC